MDKETIIKLAIEAKLPHYWPSEDEIVYIDRVTHFANLIAQHEREACAKVCESHWEKEGATNWCARAIRARGNT